jgi:prephenate dehydrogenase
VNRQLTNQKREEGEVLEKRALIIGTGLIGGSIALSLKKAHNVHIKGYDIHLEQLSKAVRLKVIDEIALDLSEAVKDVQLIVFALPVEETISLIESMSQFDFHEDVIITDVGSTKSKIMEAAEVFTKRGVLFIGGHPMAGSHKTGVESAKAHLFENAYYILTPPNNIKEETIKDLQNWLKGTKAHFLLLNPTEHDYVTGIVSHFPHLIASSLVKKAKSHAIDHSLIPVLAAGGFRDITRIASSSPKMWSDIISQNKDYLLQFLDEWIDDMHTVRLLVQQNNQEETFNFFADSKEFRDSLPIKTSGAIPAFYDLNVDVLDRVGELAKITALLAKQQISITNLRIMESREGLLGVLRMTFQTDSDCQKAESVLHMKGYETYRG